MNLKKYIGDKQFYKTTLAIALPIMVQNFITNFVSMLDNLMVGALGTEEMSGVSIVNQLFFVFNLAIFGAISGAGIFTAQFYGKKDNDGIRYTLRYKTGIGLLIFGLGIATFLLFGDKLIGLYIHDVDSTCDVNLTVELAKKYLSVILWGLLPFTVSQIFSDTLRETGETAAPMFAGIVAVFTNCLFNWLLIFGKLGFPQMGVTGAAWATNLSRYIECIIIVVYAIKKRHKFTYFKGAFKSLYMPANIFKDISLKGTPLLVNEFLWSCGQSLLSVAFSLHGLSVVAGYSIYSTVISLANIAFLTLGSSIGIIVGRELGSGNYEKAVDTDRKLITFSVFISMVIGIAVFFTADKFPELYKTSDISKMYAAYFIKVNGLLLPIDAFANASYFTLRSGGKTVVTFVFDSVFSLAVSVPLAFLLHTWAGFSIYVIFPCVLGAGILKDLFGYIMIKKRVWVNNIVA